MSQWLEEPPAAPLPEPSPPPATLYPDSATWVNAWLHVYSLRPPQWCSRWSDHPPAAARLHALWEAW